ncbi:MAG: RnfABCDGE type electron transport complex subunit G [Clostridia bacterium]|nr:RnfABCDGE type electron transport complex subunit G [Clostridia bacterium]
MDKEIKKESSALYFLRIGGTLLLICAIVALVLSFVNTVTQEKIAQNETEQKRTAMVELFGSDKIEYTELDRLESDGERVEAVYRVAEDGSTVGYSVLVLSPGFGGDVQLMVAVTADKTVIGVKIVSMSETPGLGTRVDDADYLSQYAGVTAGLSASEVDMISGATKSSKAVLNGVVDALAALDGHLGSGGVSK